MDVIKALMKYDLDMEVEVSKTLFIVTFKGTVSHLTLSYMQANFVKPDIAVTMAFGA